MIYSHSYLLVSSCINAAVSSSFFASSLSDHTDINTRLKSHRLSTVAHYHHVSLVNRHRVLSSLEMPRVHRLLSSVRYDSIYIVDTETSTPARSKIYLLYAELFLVHYNWRALWKYAYTAKIDTNSSLDQIYIEDTDMKSIIYNRLHPTHRP